MSQLDRQVFPIQLATQEPGLTAREYAAIHLGVPDSGDAELDAMIRRANRMEFAKAIAQGIAASDVYVDQEYGECVGVSVKQADALLSALEAKT